MKKQLTESELEQIVGGAMTIQVIPDDNIKLGELEHGWVKIFVDCELVHEARYNEPWEIELIRLNFLKQLGIETDIV